MVSAFARVGCVLGIKVAAMTSRDRDTWLRPGSGCTSASCCTRLVQESVPQVPLNHPLIVSCFDDVAVVLFLCLFVCVAGMW